MKILLSGVTGLGDFILKTPFIYLLSERFPDLKIDILVGNSWGIDQILANESSFELKYLSMPKSKSFVSLCIMFFNMAEKEYDYVILPYDSTDRNTRWSAFLFLKTKQYLVHFSPRYTTLKGKIEAVLLTLICGRRIHLIPVLKGNHEINANLDFARKILDLPISMNDRRPSINPKTLPELTINIDHDYLVIQPNAANGAATPKVWSPDSFLALIELLSSEFRNLKFILVGDNGDLSRLQGHPLLTHESAINLLGKTSLAQLCHIINGAKLVIAHDSSIAHIADALDKQLIALYGPGDDSKSKVLGSKSKIIYSQNETQSLMYRTSLSEEQISIIYPNFYCMSAITPEMVYNLAKDYL